MKNIVIYYSFEGNTKYVAEKIAEKLNADIYEIKLKKDNMKKGFMKYFWGGKQVVSKETPEIENIDIDFNIYDNIFIGTPVWAFTFTPAIRSLFNKIRLNKKNIVLFCTHEGGIGKTFENMKKELGDNFYIGEIDFINVQKSDKNEINTKIQDWIKCLEI